MYEKQSVDNAANDTAARPEIQPIKRNARGINCRCIFLYEYNRGMGQRHLGYTREDDGWIVYAFDGYPNGGVEDGVEQYYDDERYALSCKLGTHLDIAPWTY